MKIFNLLIISEKKYREALDAKDAKIEELNIKIGALEHDKKRLGNIVAVLERYLEE